MISLDPLSIIVGMVLMAGLIGLPWLGYQYAMNKKKKEKKNE
ncbi:MAG: hypothetical protein ACE5KE_02410 [Methanosarcinales archaeon]